MTRVEGHAPDAKALKEELLALREENKALKLTNHEQGDKVRQLCVKMERIRTGLQHQACCNHMFLPRTHAHKPACLSNCPMCQQAAAKDVPPVQRARAAGEQVRRSLEAR